MRKNRELWIALGLAVLIAAVFGRVAQHDFITYDDPAYVTENPIVQEGLTWKGVKWAFGNLHGEYTYWHPLTWLSHMLDVELFGLNAGAHHLVNVFFHALNSILLFFLFRRMTGAVWQSAGVAALFAFHPLQVDTVAWVTERKNVLSTLFWILTTMAYVRFARNGSAAQPETSYCLSRWSWYGLMVMLFAVGLMCKPALVTLPFVLLLLDYWPLGRWRLGPQLTQTAPHRNSSPAALVIEKLPLLALSTIASWITAAAHKSLGSMEVPGLTLAMRVENAIVSYGRYLGKIIWPSDLSIIYPHPGVWARTTIYLSAAVLVAITVAVLRDLRSRPYLAVGWFWFLGVLVPAIGIVQVGPQSMADRFAYVPVIGVFMMFVWVVADEAAANPARAWAPRLIYAVAVAACAITTWVQLGHWKNSETIFTHALKVTPSNYIAHMNLALHHTKNGRAEAVAEHAVQALRANPASPEPFLYLGKSRELVNDMPGAISNYHRALSINPDWQPAKRALAETSKPK